MFVGCNSSSCGHGEDVRVACRLPVDLLMSFLCGHSRYRALSCNAVYPRSDEERCEGHRRRACSALSGRFSVVDHCQSVSDVQVIEEVHGWLEKPATRAAMCMSGLTLWAKHLWMSVAPPLALMFLVFQYSMLQESGHLACSTPCPRPPAYICVVPKSGQCPVDLRQNQQHLEVQRVLATCAVVLDACGMRFLCRFGQLMPRSISLGTRASHRSGVSVSLLSAVSSQAACPEAFPLTFSKVSRTY